jgi:hypothetical protein
MTPQQLSRKIRRMREHPPITSGFERALDKCGIWSLRQFKYASQNEHWLRWLAEYDGPGYYGRKQRHQSAAFVYNHIVCPPMVLWLGEASGFQRTKVLEAKRAALSAGASLPALSSAIRKTIPWEKIESRLKKQAAG